MTPAEVQAYLNSAETQRLLEQDRLRRDLQFNKLLSMGDPTLDEIARRVLGSIGQPPNTTSVSKTWASDNPAFPPALPLRGDRALADVLQRLTQENLNLNARVAALEQIVRQMSAYLYTASPQPLYPSLGVPYLEPVPERNKEDKDEPTILRKFRLPHKEGA